MKNADYWHIIVYFDNDIVHYIAYDNYLEARQDAHGYYSMGDVRRVKIIYSKPLLGLFSRMRVLLTLKKPLQ